LFFQDMRHLSRWEVRLDGRRVESLTTETTEYDEAVFFLAVPTGTVYRSPTVSLLRRRHVGDGMQECLELANHSVEPVAVELSLLFDADFADIFEVKDNILRKRGRMYRDI